MMFELIAERNRLMEENRQLRKQMNALADECLQHVLFILEICEYPDARAKLIELCQQISEK